MWERIKIITSKIWDFIIPFLRQFLKDYGVIVLQVAFNVVREVANSMQDADGEAKRRTAFLKIKEELTKQGIQVSASIINSAIEVAVQKLKSL